jgi:phosphoribosylanthranilate isomerase
MQPTRVKICGITRPQDAAAAVAEGADEIGMILHAPSKRLISLEQAKEIVKVVPASVYVVGVFVDAPCELIKSMAKSLGLTAVQLHGHEDAKAIHDLYPLPVFKAVGVNAVTLRGVLSEARKAFANSRYRNLVGLVLDTAGSGGTGLTNDWETVAQYVAAGDLADLPPWIAAGGLTPDTVGDVVRRFRPWAVDVSSGVEERLGEKSAELIRRFIAAVREADRQIDPHPNPPPGYREREAE